MHTFLKTRIGNKSYEPELSRCLVGKNVLFIDDEYVNFLYFEELLTDVRVNLKRVCTMFQALNRMKDSEDYSCILISGSYVYENDFSFIRTLKGAFPQFPAIAVLNNVDYQLMKTCYERGFDYQLVRPIDDLHLLEILQTIPG